MPESRDKEDTVKHDHVGRRRLVKALGAGGVGAVASQWARPVIDSVVVPVHAQASGIPIPFIATASLGPTGVTLPASNWSLNTQLLGFRFELLTPGTTSLIGVHASGSGTVFGAVVQLDDLADFPDSLDLSTPDVLGSTLITLSSPSAVAQAPLVLNLAAGTYAAVFGGGSLLGATGGGWVPRNNPEIGTQSYLSYPGAPAPSWTNNALGDTYMFIS